MKVNDGGPAFPKLESLTTHDAQAAHTVRFSAQTFGGMTLRDHFAGLAMEGLVMGAQLGKGDHGPSPQITAAKAYNMADAMIAARSTGEK